MLGTRFSPWPSFSEREAELVQKVLLSNKVNYWTGEECREFECEFAGYTDCKFAISLANGTVALELALRALGIGPGDEVIVPPRTFIASASSVISVGATPVFADIDPDSQNITPDSIVSCLTPKTRAIICVHLAGWPCDMPEIMSLASKHDLKVIEDCAQAHGAKIDGRSVGSWGDIGAWSFCQDKIMTTAGEGGMVTTNNKSLWDFMWSYKDHGKSWDAIYNQDHPPGFRWIHHSFGNNYRMMEIQAVVGRYQLQQMPEWQRKRQHNAEQIMAAAEQYPCFRVPRVPSNITHAYYKQYIFLDFAHLREGWDRDRVIAEFGKQDIPIYTGSCAEVYLERAFDNSPSRPTEPLPVAHELGETSLMFLVHPTLTQENITDTCQAIHQIGRVASQ